MVATTGHQGGVEAGHVLEQDRQRQQRQMSPGIVGADGFDQAPGHGLHLRLRQADALRLARRTRGVGDLGRARGQGNRGIEPGRHGDRRIRHDDLAASLRRLDQQRCARVGQGVVALGGREESRQGQTGPAQADQSEVQDHPGRAIDQADRHRRAGADQRREGEQRRRRATHGLAELGVGPRRRRRAERDRIGRNGGMGGDRPHDPAHAPASGQEG